MVRAVEPDAELTAKHLYHVVCHDCLRESLSSGAAEAEKQVDEHRSATGHHVEFATLSNETKA
ncbi:hypothetical protein [Halobellus captivus]|uniref:hypothetical protein n=1 Tax=Halobellus captivus TaxID=2592614 RepID=UPI0011A8B8E4|nr:hypothetical protein [Halobellus captivus]